MPLFGFLRRKRPSIHDTLSVVGLRNALLLGEFPVKNLFLNIVQSRSLFRLFSSFYHSNIDYNFNNTYWKKHRWCAWDSNPVPQDGRRRWNHGAMAATPGWPIYYLLRRRGRRPSHYFKWWPMRQWTLLPLPMFVNKVKHLLNWSPTFRPPYLVDSVTRSFLWKNIYSLWPLPKASNENFDALWWLFLPETAIFTVALQAACPYWAILGEFWATIFYESTPIFLKLPF